jgi:hypothetical protein
LAHLKTPLGTQNRPARAGDVAIACHDRRDGIDALAGEYVLGVLSADEVRAVEQRMATDAMFRGRIDYWQRRLHGSMRWRHRSNRTRIYGCGSSARWHHHP